MECGIWYLFVTDSRQDQLTAFVKSIILEDEIMLLPLNGDASFRRYFRVSGKNLIAVDAPPETQKNKEFISIDKALASEKVKVPKILAYDLEKGFMLLEDLGNTTFSQVAVGAASESLYLKAVDLLAPIARTGSKLELPLFDDEFINFELSLFETWMLEKRLGITLSAEEKQVLKDAYDYICKSQKLLPYVAMHRDFHSRNLMVFEDELAVIDFQDMVKGPITYDLASLIYDCYVVLDKDLVSKCIDRAYNRYVELNILKNMSEEEFKHLLNITSLQRHIKVLGIFCRLSIRDGKNGYLKDLPRVINYVLDECKNDPHFSKLSNIIKKYVVGNF